MGMTAKVVTVSSLDDVRIEVLGEGRAHTIPAKVILHAFEHQMEPGTFEYLARSVIQFAETIDELKALQGDPERCIRKIRGHVAGLVVDARMALGLSAFNKND
jgi:hypothetical protein